jgi:hypothetical protein
MHPVNIDLDAPGKGLKNLNFYFCKFWTRPGGTSQKKIFDFPP